MIVSRPNMAAKAVQISIDEQLLQRIDLDPEVVAAGRSAFIRNAVEHYLRERARRMRDEQITSAYRAQGDAMQSEIAELLEDQLWPNE